MKELLGHRHVTTTQIYDKESTKNSGLNERTPLLYTLQSHMGLAAPSCLRSGLVPVELVAPKPAGIDIAPVFPRTPYAPHFTITQEPMTHRLLGTLHSQLASIPFRCSDSSMIPPSF